MKLSRRDFMGYCSMSAAALGLGSVLAPLETALASTSGPAVIWLKGAGCTGCTVSLTNRISSTAPVDVADLLINTIDLVYHPTLMGAAGDLAVTQMQNAKTSPFVLVVEGAIPTQYNGAACTVYTKNGVDVTALQAVKDLAPRAKKVISVGTCACFGGLSAAAPNPTLAQSVKAATGINTLNIPGCPPHPDWMVWAIAQTLAGASIAVDSQGRPTALYGKTIHSQCSRQSKSWSNSLASTGLCNVNLGCKGRNTKADCPTRKWNNGMNWCVGTVTANGNGADGLCLGCTETGFPDKFAPIFSTQGAIPSGHKTVNPPKQNCTQCHGRKT